MKEALINCFKDTIELSNSILLPETKLAINSSKVYKENFVAKKGNAKQTHLDIFDYCVVEKNTTLNAARNYLQYGKTAVMNFANPHNPGGGVHNGAMAQEECLCRSSNLYSCISNENVYEEYYLYNRNIANNFFSDRLIYTKDVTVFKDDSDVPQFMPKTDWFKVDVITCAAPYIAKRKYTNRTALKELFKGRIKNIFEAAIDNGVEVIVLGAFGCGAFKNPPEIVAKAFHEVIKENDYACFFNKIVFAIKSNNSSNINYNVFYEELFKDHMQVVLKMPPLPLIEPLRSRCDESNDFMNYQEWKCSNKYHGKQFSILGDSISTLAGYNPKGYKVFYNDENCEKSGVREMQNTWWGKVIDFFGGELLVNNSWSGSRVTRLPKNESLFPSGCSNERTGSLHINSVNPDVIIIYLGTNDWAFNAEIDGTSFLTDEMNMYYFSNAYSKMIQRTQINYPNAEIWCCTLNTTFLSSNSSFEFPYAFGGTHIEKYNQIIKDTADMHKCKVIDLYDYHIPYDSIDGSHPNAEGMNTLATIMIREIGGKETDRFLDCENEQHEFGLTYGYDQNYNGGYKICKKCGKIDYQSSDNNKCFDFEPLDVNEDKNKMENKPIYEPNIEYVKLPIETTRPFFDNTLKLFDVDNKEKIEIKKDKIDLGRSSDCEININDNCVSRVHASFYFEEPSWFIMDKNSKNGTYLNGNQLEENKKYELYTGDTISIANSRQFIFNDIEKKTPPVADENDMLEVLHKALDNVWQNDDTEALKVVALLLAKLPMYFPMDYDFYEMFGNINPLELKKGDVIKTTKDVKIKVLTLQTDNEEIIPMFTTSEQAHKGPSVNISRLYPQDYLPSLISMNKSIAINPFDEKAVSLKPVFFKDIVLPLVQSMMQDNESSKKENLKEVSVGSVIDEKYELLSLVGQGGTTKVYLAKDKRINRQWAVKILKNDLQNYVQSKNALLREAQMLKRLNHPAIPDIVDIIASEECFAIIMDYVEGVSLDSIVENYGKQSVENIIDWSIQICDVLGYLHSQNPPYIYRDMKPSNVILKPDGRISLIDFGIMRTYKQNNLADTVCLGTAGFAAPEQFGTAQTDCRSDIYALGMTMYNLFVGMRPERNKNLSLDNGSDSLSKGLISIIKKCTELNRDDRYQSCAELRDELDYLKKNKKLKKKFKLFG